MTEVNESKRIEKMIRFIGKEAEEKAHESRHPSSLKKLCWCSCSSSRVQLESRGSGNCSLFFRISTSNRQTTNDEKRTLESVIASCKVQMQTGTNLAPNDRNSVLITSVPMVQVMRA